MFHSSENETLQSSVFGAALTNRSPFCKSRRHHSVGSSQEVQPWNPEQPPVTHEWASWIPSNPKKKLTIYVRQSYLLQPGHLALDAMCTVANVARHCEASCSVQTCMLRKAILATNSSVVVVGSSHKYCQLAQEACLAT